MNLDLIAKETNMGESKYGGFPDLPSKMDYPEKNGKYYKFLFQLNFSELGLTNQLYPKKGILYFFIGAIKAFKRYEDSYSSFDYKALYIENCQQKIITKKGSKDEKRFFNNENHDFNIDKSKAIVLSNKVEADWMNCINISRGMSYKDPIYLERIGMKELGVNVMISSENYFGRKSGICSVETLVKDESESFYKGELSRKEWVEKLIKFDKEKEYHKREFDKLICLISIPSCDDIGISWGDLLNLEIYMSVDELKNLNFNNLTVKLAPD